MGPSFFNSKQAQGVFVILPDREVPLALGDPCTGCGSKYFYSGSGDDLNRTMTRAVASGGALTAQVRYDIEFDWDYAFLEASTDGGGTWQSVVTNRSQTDSDGQSGFNVSRTGLTGDTAGAWAALTANLPVGTNAIRFRYQTDAAFALSGFQVDQIAIGGTLVGTAESDEGWTFDGFRITSGSETQLFFNAYVLENRQYLGYDDGLRTGPYNFGFNNTTPDWVEHFSYRSGLLISYWNSQYTDNNVGDHPGGGLVLPIDAHPQFTHWADGTLMRPRILSFDSTFGLDKVPALTLHNNGVATTIPAKPAVPVFSDANNPWSDCDGDACTGAHPGRYQPGWYSVDIPNTGTKVRVKSVSSRASCRSTSTSNPLDPGAARAAHGHIECEGPPVTGGPSSSPLRCRHVATGGDRDPRLGPGLVPARGARSRPIGRPAIVAEPVRRTWPTEPQYRIPPPR